MASRPLKAVLTVAAAAAFSLTAVPAQAADPDPSVWTELSHTYGATGAYAYEPYAVADGFAPTPCTPGTGYRYVNQANVGQTDAAKPAALLYEDGPYGRRLIGVEWVVKAESGAAAPAMFGQTFQQPVDLPEVGSSYTLRAWIYKTNPSGLFSATHPDVTCSADSGADADADADSIPDLDLDLDLDGLIPDLDDLIPDLNLDV
ncbi:hypothetical protein M2163_005793 [Streptomyces sp. SAI-135]|uniref:hypothetical protein n=1 Tax=unclassified Streptomyces TaxID=2593676 RepID=UPI002476F0A1|nr:MULTISPECIES: hypothetical protein [unclassified Streptomyces]MDH6517226.1 hypothetical protein [Streptomyces sp. SAI-090]MDH6549448.1 hypothetical protein [Streptomyces sp. SAI-041]MDH6586545.1 hypothetical protein [Streptomyces sp. SAI-133]MDH6618685.1 hypothetical protein [Streptomyces sp. SAI-135]